MAKPKLGGGKRFSALSSALASRPGVNNPDALAASIGRKKYGAKHFNALSARARGRKSHGRHVKQQANLIAKTGEGPATPGSSTFGSRTGGS